MPSFILRGAALMALILLPSHAIAQQTRRVSVDSMGMEGAGTTFSGAISADGRFAAFFSHAENLVPGDTNGFPDAFVHDRLTGKTTRVSVDSLGGQANGPSDAYRDKGISISGDGQFVAFESEATNLVAGDTNGDRDIFVHDRLTRETTRVTVLSGGGQHYGGYFPSISADGRMVAFCGWGDYGIPGHSGYQQVHLHDRWLVQTYRASSAPSGVSANSWCYRPIISADGRNVIFESMASNLVSGTHAGVWYVFLYDHVTRLVEVASLDNSGRPDGGDTRAISGDGQFVVFGDAGYFGTPGFLAIRDRIAGTTTSRSWRNVEASISADGRFLAFDSSDNNLVPNDYNNADDVFVWDRESDVTTRVSVNARGEEGNGTSSMPRLSANGHYLTYLSAADNLVPGDTNAQSDAFGHARGPGTTSSVNTIILTSSFEVAVGQPVTYSWFAAPPGSHWWLLVSGNDAGSSFGGHPFGVGHATRVIAHGYCTARGTGTFTTPPLPPWTSGRTFYVEVGAQDVDGAIYDSNTLERIVQ